MTLLRRSASLLVWLLIAVAAFGFATTEAVAEVVSKYGAWQLGPQAPYSPVAEQTIEFWNVLLVIIILIAVFVLGLMAYVCVRFKASNNPTPTKTTHNTLIEVLWTAVPVLILVVIAVPSFKLLYFMDHAVDPEMTIKVNGQQWSWNYEYPDDAVSFDSLLLEPDEIKDGQTYLLDVDNPLVLPVGKRVQILLASDNVMHSFIVPSLMLQIYTTPGRTNETWVQVTEPGTFYGQCNQICGTGHSYMPIVIKALSEADYAAWLKKAKVEFAMDGTVRPVQMAVARQPGQVTMPVSDR